jgi:hypothetical protein
MDRRRAGEGSNHPPVIPPQFSNPSLRHKNGGFRFNPWKDVDERLLKNKKYVTVINQNRNLF